MRQFVSAVSPDKDGLLEISGKDYNYFRNVLRISAGDMVAVRLSGGGFFNSTVAKIDGKKRTVLLQICADARPFSENQSSFDIPTEFYLFQFAAKGPKMDAIIRQSAECGISKIIPVLGEFSQAGSSEKNFRNERYARIIKEARQQSGSPVQTEISDAADVAHAVSIWNEICGTDKNKCFACVLYERNEKTENLHRALGGFDEIKKCAVFCGGEGGISPKEADFFIKNGIIPVHFNTNILRCETAAVYGIAALQTIIAEKNEWNLKKQQN